MHDLPSWRVWLKSADVAKENPTPFTSDLRDRLGLSKLVEVLVGDGVGPRRSCQSAQLFSMEGVNLGLQLLGEGHGTRVVSKHG